METYEAHFYDSICGSFRVVRYESVPLVELGPSYEHICEEYNKAHIVAE